jgi:hypothetical protein
MAKGNTTLFRELGTPEGDYHAMFTSNNARLRRQLHALAKDYPQDEKIQAFVRQADGERMQLWEAWKRGGLSPAMRRIVDTVREEHHGPDVLT